MPLPFPTKQLFDSKVPIAIIITPGGMILRYIKLIDGKFFIVKGFGVFKVDTRYGIPYGKQPIYFYNSQNMTPISPALVSELNRWADRNRLHKITKKDVRHGGRLRQLYKEHKIPKNKRDSNLTQLLETEFSLKQKIINKHVDAAEDEINKSKTTEHPIQTDLKEIEDTTGNIEKYHPAFWLTEILTNQGLLEPDEAMNFEKRVKIGDITFAEFIDELRENERVVVYEPLDMGVQKFIDDISNVDPNEIDSFIGRAERLGKKIQKMISPPVRNVTSAALVFALIVGGAFAVLIVSQADLGNLIKLPGSGKFILQLFGL